MAASSFSLHVLPLTWADLGYCYTVDEMWPKLVRANLGRAAFVFDQTDIRVYDWDRQEILLSDRAVARLTDSTPNGQHAPLVDRAFVASLNGRRLFGGLVYDQGSAAAIRFPVIHALGNPISVLRIRPAMGQGWNPSDPRFEPQRSAIANPLVVEWLMQRGLVGSIPAAERPPDPFARQ